MQLYRFAAFAALLSVMVTGCAKPPERTPGPSHHYRSAAAEVVHPKTPAQYQTASVINQQFDSMATGSIGPTRSDLAGRTLTVASISDLRLRPGEVILTFDDGPSPTHTPKILDALDEYGVKATFFMVGHMAKAHRTTAQKVALAGHTIGTHTHRHENLAKLSEVGAMKAIGEGERAISSTLAPIGMEPAPFFRFPYLAHTSVLRAGLGDLGVVIFDVDVDSLDFKKDSAGTVLQRTLSRLDKAGGGIMLFHDLHARTARMMPELLSELQQRGYKVVHAAPKQTGFPGIEIRSAEVVQPLGNELLVAF